MKKQTTGRISCGSLCVVAILVPALVIAVLTAGCLSQAGPGASSPTGGPGTGNGVTSIGSIIENPTAYENRTVMVAGKITLECGSGCWFNLDDGSGIIYVDMAAHNFVIPQKGGAHAVVTGRVKAGKGVPTLSADQVEIDGQVYP